MQTQQLGALNDSRFDIAPFVGRNQERDNIDFPGTICAERIAVNVVGDAVLADAALGTRPAPSQLFRARWRAETPSGAPSEDEESRHRRTTRHMLLRSGAESDRDRQSWQEPPHFVADSRLPTGCAGRESSGKSGLISSSGIVIGTTRIDNLENVLADASAASAAFAGRPLYSRPSGGVDMIRALADRALVQRSIKVED